MDASTTWWQRVPSQAVGVFAGASGLALIALGVQASSTRATWPDLFERVFLLLARVLGG